MQNLGTINGRNLHVILSPSEVDSVINALRFYSEALSTRHTKREDFWKEWRAVARDSSTDWADALASKIASAAQSERIASGSQRGAF
jgi:hypothetical protein